jgi:4-hydroxy-3-methylbut-2-enyl diphosphate reductase IspH
MLRAIQTIVTERPEPQLRRNRDAEKANITRNLVETSHHQFLMVIKDLLVILCGNIGHPETVYSMNAKEQASYKKDTKDKSQQWKKDKADKIRYFTSAYASRKDDNDDEDFDKEDFMTSFMESFTTAQKNKKNKRRRSDNDDNNDSDDNYLLKNSFKTEACKI